MVSKIEKLLKAGVITQDPENPEKVIFNVPLVIPKVAIEADAFELFAKEYGWQPEVPELNEDNSIKADENGDVILIPNPVSPIEHDIEVVRNFATEVLRKALLKEGERQGRQAAQERFNALNI